MSTTTTPTTPTSEKAEMLVTFARLRSGEWGLRGPTDELFEDATVTVTRRDGSRWLAVVDRVIWSGDGVALATIVPPEDRGQCWECGQWGRVGRRCRWCNEGTFRRRGQMFRSY